MTTIQLSITITEEYHDTRLDLALSKLVPEYSRAQIQNWIKAGFVTLNGDSITSPKHKVFSEQTFDISAKLTVQTQSKAQAIELDIIYEDEAILVINKAAGMITHPGAGNPDNTLLNALLHHCPALQTMPRAGIVHRLDKGTTGLLVIAKTLAAQNSLVEQLQARSIKRHYEAIVIGQMTAGGRIEKPIGRHPKNRLKMAITPGGKSAITHFRIIERFKIHTHIKVMLETGRTHQIRVHMSDLGYPLVGDKAYGARPKLPPKASDTLIKTLQTFNRPALHAKSLGLIHPELKEAMQWEVPLPEDFERLRTLLREEIVS